MHHIASLDHNDLVRIQGVKGTSPLKTLHMYGNVKRMVSRKHGLKKTHRGGFSVFNQGLHSI